MKILHYSLGLPPFRSGGLTKYSFDLIKGQARLENEVSLLYPGTINIKTKTKIVPNKGKYGINIYEIINPLPIPLLNGVKKPRYYYAKKDETYFYNWLKDKFFDVIHIHTIMGIPVEFLKAAKRLHIKMIYTTHDYYGICPKVNLIKKNSELCVTNENYSECKECCVNGFDYKKIILMQSKPYRIIKGTKLGNKTIKIIKKRSNKCNDFDKESVNLEQSNLNEKVNINEYKKLQEYYYNIFNLIDYYHFNSTITEMVYKRYLKNIKGKVINITHADIHDNREIKKFDAEKLRILFLGNELQYKGLPLLLESLKQMPKNKWKLNVYGTDKVMKSENITYHGKYSHDDLGNIFKESDVIILPSIWYETFSLVALEAYSFGVPIIMTDLIGFKDNIVDNLTGFIISADSSSLSDKIRELLIDKNKLVNVNKQICLGEFKFFMDDHIKEIISLYKNN